MKVSAEEMRALVGLAVTLARAGQLADARALWEGIAVLRPDDGVARRWLAQLSGMLAR